MKPMFLFDDRIMEDLFIRNDLLIFGDKKTRRIRLHRIVTPPAFARGKSLGAQD